MKIEKANASDLAGILTLLQENKLPTEGVTELLPYLLVIKDDEGVIGCAGLEVYGPVGLLRSVAVREKNQGQGLGTLLTKAMLRLAQEELQMQKVYLLTTTAATFFQQFGFEVVPRNQVDPVIQHSAEFASLCPATAVVMVKKLG